MRTLLESVLQAHGGPDRWNTFDNIRATFRTSGGLLPMKGFDLSPTPSQGIASIHEESTLVPGFRRADWQMRFTPQRIAIETMDGVVVEERENPRASFAGHSLSTAWDLMQLAYFNGYARWTYLTTPFFMAMPGFQVAEIEPWHEGPNEVWRGLRVQFPDSFASHSKEQDLYFGPDFLLRRHDYKLEIAGGVAVAQYVHDPVEAEGFLFPSKRRAYVRGPKLKPIHDLLLISIDLSDYQLTKDHE